MADTLSHLAVFPLPSPDDSLSTLSLKLTAALYTLHYSLCLPIAFGKLLPSPPRPDTSAELQAKAHMKSRQKAAYKSWVSGKYSDLPVLNSTRDKRALPPPNAAEGPRREDPNGRIAALNRIYKTTVLNAEHLQFIIEVRPECLPLVGAVARVIKAERNLEQVGKGENRGFTGRWAYGKAEGKFQLETLEEICWVAKLAVADLDLMKDRSEVADRVREQSTALGKALEEMKRDLESELTVAVRERKRSAKEAHLDSSPIGGSPGDVRESIEGRDAKGESESSEEGESTGGSESGGMSDVDVMLK